MIVCFSQILKVHIINVEEYEKQENFYIILEEPKWLKRGISGKCVYVCVCLSMCFDYLQENGDNTLIKGT